MKKIHYVLMACFVLFIVSCGNSSTAPGEVVKAFYKDIDAGNFDAAIEYYDLGEAVTEEDKASFAALCEKGKAQFDSKGGLKDVEVLEETISEDGTTANVKINVTYQDGTTEEFDQNLLLDKNGNWKMTFLLNQ